MPHNTHNITEFFSQCMFQIYVFSALLTSPVNSFSSIHILQKHALKDKHTTKKKKKKKKKNTHRQDVVVTGMFCDSSLNWISTFSTLFNMYNTLKHATGNFNIHHRIDPAKFYVLFLLLFTEPKLWPTVFWNHSLDLCIESDVITTWKQLEN